MKITRKKMALVIAGGLAVTAALTGCATASDGGDAAACTPKYTFSTITEGTLAVSTYDGMPYFGTADDGSQQGFDADFLNQFAADSCLTVDWQVLPAASVIEAVQSGRADVAAGGWYATPERGEVVNLSDPTYVELPMIFSTDGTTDIQALAGKTVGTVTGYTWIDELKAIADVKEYQSSDATLADIAAGRLDYALLGSIDAPYIVTQNPAYSGIQGNLMLPDAAISSSVTPSLPNYPSTKGNDELTAAINEAIAAAKADGSFATILGTYGLSADLLNTDNFQ